MGVRGLWSYVRSNDCNFRRIKLQNSFIVLDGFNFINTLYFDSQLLTQYNGEYLAFDNAIVEFLLNLKKCNLEPIFVFDGVHEFSKLETVLKRSRDRLCTLSNLQLKATRGPVQDGTSPNLHVSIQPHLSCITFFSTLDRLGARYFVVDYEADQLAAALAIYLGAPLLSNDSDFFVMSTYWAEEGGGGLMYVPTTSCHFRSPCSSESGFYIQANVFVGREGPAFKKLAPIQIPLFAALSGNDFVPNGYFDPYLPGVAPQQARAKSMGATQNSANFKQSQFRALTDWLAGFGNDIVAPVERIMSRMPAEHRPEAAQKLYSALACYYIPFRELEPYLKYLFGDSPPPCRVTQNLPSVQVSDKTSYGLRALQVLAEGAPEAEFPPHFSDRFVRAFRQGKVAGCVMDSLYAYGVVCNAVVEDFQSREPFQLCSVTLRRLSAGLLYDNPPPNGPRFPGLVSNPQRRPSYNEYHRRGCKDMDKQWVNIIRVSLRDFQTGFKLLQHHLYLPERPSIIPKWLHTLACVVFLWARFDPQFTQSDHIATSPIALATCACTVAVKMAFLQNTDADGKVPLSFCKALVNRLASLRRTRGAEPLRFHLLHAYAQLQSILLHFSNLVRLIDALAVDDSVGCDMETLPAQVMFPSGCLAHHIACQLADIPSSDRLPRILNHWLPTLLGRVNQQYLEQVTSMFSGLVKFVDTLLRNTPPAEFRHRRMEREAAVMAAPGPSTCLPPLHNLTPPLIPQPYPQPSGPYHRLPGTSTNQRFGGGGHPARYGGRGGGGGRGRNNGRHGSAMKRSATGEAVTDLESIVERRMREAGLEDEQ